jgi:hypothetical protein
LHLNNQTNSALDKPESEHISLCILSQKSELYKMLQRSKDQLKRTFQNRKRRKMRKEKVHQEKKQVLRTKIDHKAEGEEAFVLAQRNENHDNVWLLRKCNKSITISVQMNMNRPSLPLSGLKKKKKTIF